MDQLGHAPHDVALGAADERLLGQPREGVVEDCRRATNRRQLGAVLHLPQPLDEPSARDELGAARGKRLEPGVSQPLGLEADPSRQPFGEVRVEVAPRLHCLHAANRPGTFRIAEVGEQLHAIGLDQHRRVRAVEPAEVTDVDRAGDEQRLLERGLQAIEPVLHDSVSARYTSASW